MENKNTILLNVDKNGMIKASQVMELISAIDKRLAGIEKSLIEYKYVSLDELAEMQSTVDVAYKRKDS